MADNFGTLLTSPIGTQQSFGIAGPIVGIFGAINSAIGSYYQAQSAQYQYQSQAYNLKFQAGLANINQDRASFQAATIMQAGERQIGAVTMRAGQTKGAALASMAARGISLGVGSAAEVIETTDLIREIDALTINTNRVRAAEETKTQALNYGIQSSLLGASATNAAASGRSINPTSSALTSLIGSAASLAPSWYQKKSGITSLSW